MKKTVISAVFAIGVGVIITLVSACDQFTGIVINTLVNTGGENRAVQFDRNTFNQERALWEAQHITGYIFTEIYFPGCPMGNVRITVSENEAINFEPLEDPEEYMLFGETISGIYDKIEEDVARWEEQFRTGSAPYNAVNFTISYNETYHFPEEIHFSIIEPDLAGGWYDVTIEDFVTAEIASQK
jgi:hypothetical protein